MTQRIKSGRTLALLGLALLLSGCGSLKLPSLTTGSLGSNEQQPAANAAPAVKPDDPVERAVQVGVTIAQANKCGYYFDPAQLKANYFAAEAVRYPAPDVQKKVQTSLEFGRIRVSRQIAQTEGYCSSDRTKKIKAKLTRYLAGDYTAEAKKKPVPQNTGLFGLTEAPLEQEKFDPEKIFDPITNRTKQ